MDDLTPYVGTGVLIVQALLLWRVRVIEREQHYHQRLHHWAANVLTIICLTNNIDVPDKPERLAP